MKLKLWKVHFQSPYYENEYETTTVSAPNARCAIDRACKISYLYRVRSMRNAVESVELIGVAEN